MQNNNDKLSKVPEIKAQHILEEYDGFNNYILGIKKKSEKQKHFKLTRAQADYIISFHQSIPKIARKWVELDGYFGKKMMEEKLLTKIPEKVYVEKILIEKDKSFHIWGKVFENQQLHDFWLPKVALIPTQKVKEVSIDYEKYSHRPPLSHQKEAIETLASHDKYILADDMGLGKAMPNNTLVYTPNGKVEISSLNVGDEVIGSNGKPHKVNGVYPQGIRPTYKITFNDGYSILCDEEHLWKVTTSNHGYNTNNDRKDREIVLSTKQMLDKDLTLEKKGVGYNSNRKYKFKTYYKQKNGNLKWQIPTVKPIEFNKREELPIDPYLLGLLLGDGYIANNTTVRFTLHKDDFDEMLSSYLTSENKSNKESVRIGSVVIGESLKKLDLIGKKSFDKFVPNVYKTSSIENRLLLLQGLMDTDGYCQKSENGEFKSAEFYSVSEKLVDDVIEIVHSLGGIGRKRSKIPTYTYRNEKLEGKECFICNIKLPEEFIPFRLGRKVNEYNPPKKYKVGRYIKNIEYHSEQECVCISVNSPDKLYVCEHGIVTHNTTSTVIAALESGAERVLIVCPASLKINWMREIQNYTDKSISIIEGKKWESADFVIINYDILKNFHDIKNKEESIILQEGFDLVVADECFTYETLVQTEIGPLKIGDIVENKLNYKILSYNHKTNKTEYKEIFRWIRKKTDTIYKIKLQNGVFIECTGNHKIYTQNKGYIRADEITKNDTLLSLSKNIDEKTNLEKSRNLQSKLWDNIKIFKNSTKNKRKNLWLRKKMQTLWQFNEVSNNEPNEQKNILFNKLFKQTQRKKPTNYRKNKKIKKKNRLVSVNERYPFKKSSNGYKILRKNEKTEPDVQFKKCGKNEKFIKRENFFIERGERKNNKTTKNNASIIRGGMGNGTPYKHKRLYWEREIPTHILQSRYWKLRIQNRNRNRWEESQHKKMEIFRLKKSKNTEFTRVESIEIQKRRGQSEPKYMSSKNIKVYNLEIIDNHNYFSNDILVSNCHYIQNAQASRTKLFNDFSKQIKKLWLLSGTPMTSRPINYYNLLNLVESPVAYNWMAYVIRYCEGYQFNVGNRKVWNVNGSSNLLELRDRTKTHVLRRLKEDILDLPDKILTPVYLKLKSKEYEELMGEYYDWMEDESEKKSLTVQFSKLMKVRQVIAENKIKETCEIAENIIEQGKKVIIFTNFTDTLNQIADHFGKSAVKLDGKMSKPARQHSVDQFQENDKIKVFVGNLKAAGVGITLTAAEAVIMNDLSFVPSDHSQAEDRAYRYGQKSNVSVFYPIFENSIEGIIYDILSQKKNIFETVMGDNEGKGDIMEEIINEISVRR